MTLQLHRFINKPISSNCYVLFDRTESDRCILVDPGSDESSEIGIWLYKENLFPEYIILTHEHFDHIAGCNFIIDKYHAKLICSSLCFEYIQSAKRNLSLFQDQKGFVVYGELALEVSAPNTIFSWGKHNILLFPSNGHTDAGISFITGQWLFTGDTLIRDIKTVTKLYSGSKEALILSMNQYEKLKGEKYIVCAGHGEMFDLDNYDLKKMIGK